MNIMHIDEQLGWRGGEQQTSWIIRGLAKQGHTVLLAGRPNGKFLQADHGAEGLIRIPAPFRTEFDPWTAWKLARVAKRHAVDILHAQTSHAHSIACMVRTLAGRGQVIVSRRVAFKPRNGRLNRWKYDWPDRYIAVSNRVAEVLREYGIPQNRVTVVHSSVDPARLEAEPLSRAELGVPEGVPLLGTAGALVGHKDHANLINALPAILCEIPDLRVVIAGEGELRPALEAQIADLSLRDTVTLLGHRTDVPRVLRALDVYVSSSWSEGLGTSILEALTCEIPVVATLAGGAAEMVVDNETGFLIPIEDPDALAAAVIRMFRDSPAAKTMAQNGRQRVLDKFAVDKMVEGNLRVYESLL